MVARQRACLLDARLRQMGRGVGGVSLSLRNAQKSCQYWNDIQTFVFRDAYVRVSLFNRLTETTAVAIQILDACS